MNRMVLAATMSLLVLSACGTSTQDRALSGGAMGAAAGGVGGLLFDHPVAGALVHRSRQKIHPHLAAHATLTRFRRCQGTKG